ncbi:MAG: ATPase [Clostridiales bacterium]|nr:ATPase [Clostridiales bacterium]
MTESVLSGGEALGIEFGSTRIKAVLVDENGNPVASGSHTWENKFENGYWTYSLNDVWSGVQSAYNNLNENVFNKFKKHITTLSAIGFSAMMHGYLVFDKNDNQLAEFRTWRNTTTKEAAEKLSDLFSFNIPQRWSIAHLYQAVLNNESHINSIDFITTLAGYVHWQLTGEKVIGIGDASGMFPVDDKTGNYNAEMLEKFSAVTDVLKCNWNICDILPKIMLAGECAGRLSEKGARLLDTSGNLRPGIPLCPPEGDAGTGMTATNSISINTGNISAGTSIFSMIVLEKPLSRVYEEIDIVAAPNGNSVAMVHCNNCCTDLDYWISIFSQFSDLIGNNLDKSEIYDILYNSALDGDYDCGGLLNYNYFSGEPVARLQNGIPVFLRKRNAVFNLKNFMRAQIYSSMAALKLGMEKLENENVRVTRFTGHGGMFKTPYVAQKLMAGAFDTPVSVMETAGEGGAWGMALLALYMIKGNGKSLETYLYEDIFSKYKSKTILPDNKDTEGFCEYMKLFKKGLAVEKTASESI